MMKATELAFAFIVNPLDDCIDSDNPILAKWQVRETLHTFIDDYIDRLMSDDEYATILVAGKKHKTK